MINLQLHTARFADADASVAAARLATGADLDAFEVVAASEMGDRARAERLFAQLAAVPEIGTVVRHIRHLLRTNRPDEAAARAEPFLQQPDADQLWPYIGTIWRLTGDPRLAWLEADGRFGDSVM